MKKPLAIFLLIIGGAASVTLVAFMTMVVFVVLSMFISAGGEWALYTIVALFVYALSYLARHPRIYYKKKYNVNDAVFIACTCAPSLIAAAAVYFTYTPEESGVDATQVRLLFWLIAAAAFTLGLILRACGAVIRDKIEQKRKKAWHDKEDTEQ